MKPTHHFAPIEGLRGYLALWVAIGHGMQTAGFLTLPGPLKLLMAGEQAVFVFVILSGFVITNLLLQDKERYGAYITRRFFRLFPAFVAACAAGYLVMPLWVEVVQHTAFRQDGSAYATRLYEIANQTRQHTGIHALWHALMLHGLLPNEWLSVSSMTFLPAAWSISLEWQFYLIAPLVLMARHHRPLATALLLTFIVLHLAYHSGRLGSYSVNASIAGMMAYFAIGIVSRLAFQRLQALSWPPLQVALLGLFVMIALSRSSLAAMVWIAFLSFLAWKQHDRVAGKAFEWLFTNRVMLLLGTVSYSLYLFHRPVQVAFAWLAQTRFGVQSGRDMVLVELAAIACAVPVAYLAYRLIEVPGQQLGKRLAARLPPQNWRSISAMARAAPGNE